MAFNTGGYQPAFFASTVLPNGQFIINGGKINDGRKVWANLGALYDPVASTWRSVPPPPGWSTIGNAAAVVMPNGTYMLANCRTREAAALDLATMTWTPVNRFKADINQNEGWTLLPSGQILTVDANNTADPRHTEILTNGTWASAGDTPVLLADIGTATNSHLMGPQILRPDGTVVAIGATGNTAIYTIATHSWAAGPVLPKSGIYQDDAAPGAAVLLPDGDIFFDVGPGIGYFNHAHDVTYYFLFTAANKIVPVPAPPIFTGVTQVAFQMLVVPTGQVVVTGTDQTVYVYTPSKPPLPQYAPRITDFPATVSHGGSYTLTGLYLNGFSAANAYGAASQSATNYPIARFTNLASGTVTYARTSNFSSMAVANPNPVTAEVDVPATIPTGPSTLTVITNGNPSVPVDVTVN